MDKVDNNETEELNEQAQVPKWLIVVTCLAVTILIALGVFLVSNYTATTPTDQSTIHGYYGTFGDYIGGIMNPLMTFITVFLLLYTVNQNHKMISISSKELKQSNIELEQTRQAISDQAKSADLKIDMELIEDITEVFEKILSQEIRIRAVTQAPTLLELINMYDQNEKGKRNSIDFINHFMSEKLQKHRSDLRSISRLTDIFNSSISNIIKVKPGLELLYEEHIIPKTIRVLHHSIAEKTNHTVTEIRIKIHGQEIYKTLNPDWEETFEEMGITDIDSLTINHQLQS